MSAPPSQTQTRNPLNDDGPSAAFWTRINAAEAVPGVPTPLGYTFWLFANDASVDGAHCRLGSVSRSELHRNIESTDDQVGAIFFGRSVLNVDRLRWLADGYPGTNGDDFEREVLGSVRPGVSSAPRRRRYPAVLAKAPIAALRQSRETGRVVRVTDEWWHSAIANAASADAKASVTMLLDARSRFRSVMTVHVLNAILGAAVVGALSRSIGTAKRELFLQAAGGLAGAEREMTQRLWQVARGEIDLDTFLSRFGFHGPEEGEMSNRSWREDPSPLTVIIDSYRSRTSDQAPSHQSDAVDSRRRAASAEIVSGLPRRARLRARMLLAAVRHFGPLREQTKASFLQCIDVGRAAARRLGHLYTSAGLLRAPDDVWYLTVDEVVDPPADAADLAATRRAERQSYLSLSVPDTFSGLPVPASISNAHDTSELPDGAGAMAESSLQSLESLTTPPRRHSSRARSWLRTLPTQRGRHCSLSPPRS
jgi:hypothetical protein